jgi:PPOX class probable F420-dependent enzyme
MVFDTGSDGDRHALERLATDRVGWLSTVTPDGQPQTMPIWFLWEDGEALIYSDLRAKRLANLRANPKVSLHLNDDGRGDDIVLIEGVARFDESTPPVTANPAYLAKYADWIEEMLVSAERMAETYNIAIRIRPVRGRHFG